MISDLTKDGRQLTVEGKKFIRWVCKTHSTKLLSGNSGKLLYSNAPDKDQIWSASIYFSAHKDEDLGILYKTGYRIVDGSGLADYLIYYYNFWAEKYGLDANILAAQGYVESRYVMWAYPPNSSASGVSQFTMETVFSVIVDNFSNVEPRMTNAEIDAITDGLEDPKQLTSYILTKKGKATDDTIQIARDNRPKLHQNIINNPSTMIKAQARYMKYISGKSNKLASTSLLAYNRGIKFTAKTYTDAINSIINEDGYGESYLKEGIDYVLSVFAILGDKNNQFTNVKEKYLKGYSFGFDELLNLGEEFNDFQANVAESDRYDLNSSSLDTLTIVDDNRYKTIYFPEDQYIRKPTTKNQITLHHTVSGPGVEGDVSWWKEKGERVATSFMIDRLGGIYQLFSTNYWAHHLGIYSDTTSKLIGVTVSNTTLNKAAIGFEIDSWGGLIQNPDDGLWYPAKMDNDGNNQRLVANISAGKIDNVQEYNSDNGYPVGFRGFFGFEKYTTSQITAVRDLILSIKVKFPQIDLKYKEDIWDLENKDIGCPNISTNALIGKSGVWTHTSYRTDKSDCHPQPELIEMLQNLNFQTKNNENWVYNIG